MYQRLHVSDTDIMQVAMKLVQGWGPCWQMLEYSVLQQLDEALLFDESRCTRFYTIRPPKSTKKMLFAWVVNRTMSIHLQVQEFMFTCWHCHVSSPGTIRLTVILKMRLPILARSCASFTSRTLAAALTISLLCEVVSCNSTTECTEFMSSTIQVLMCAMWQAGFRLLKINKTSELKNHGEYDKFKLHHCCFPRRGGYWCNNNLLHRGWILENLVEPVAVPANIGYCHITHRQSQSCK